MDSLRLTADQHNTLLPEWKGQIQVMVLDRKGIPFGCFPSVWRAYLYVRDELWVCIGDKVDGVELRDMDGKTGWEVWSIGNKDRLEFRILPVVFRD